jgi:mannose-6-phosphate isomerase-like protein (cupin superfamily)
MTRYVFSTTDTIRYRFPTHVNDLVMDRSEAATSEVFIVVLEPGEAPPLHLHPDYEQIFYMLEGSGVLQIGETPHYYPVKPGDLIRIPVNTHHRILCTGSQPVRYLSIDAFVEGRESRPEPTWDSHVQALCREYGWDFDQVRIKR